MMTHLISLPGNPAEVNRHADAMRSAAKQMLEAAHTLRELSDVRATTSRAVDKFRIQAGEVREVLTDASVRYSSAAGALDHYWPVLKQAQEEADAAIAAANRTDVGGADARAAALRSELTADGMATAGQMVATGRLDLEEVREKRDQLAAAEEQARQERAALEQAEADYQAAVKKRDAAAKEAIDRIDAGERASDLNDTWVDDLKGFKEQYLDPVVEAVMKVVGEILKPLLKKLTELFDMLAELAGLISMILTILAAIALVLSVIPVLAPITLPLAGALFGAAKFAGAVSAVASLAAFATRGARFLLGDLTLGAMISATLTLVTSLALKKFLPRFGKALSKSGLDQRLAGAGGAAGKGVIEYEVGLISNVGGDVAKDKWHQKFDAPGALWDGVGSAVDAGSSHDVSDLSTDFSTVDTDTIISDAFGQETVANRGAPVSVCSVATVTDGAGA